MEAQGYIQWLEFLYQEFAKQVSTSIPRSNRKSLWYHYVALALSEKEPSRLEAAKLLLGRWLRDPGLADGLPYFQKWSQLIQQPITQMRSILMEPGVQTLRSTSPLAAVFHPGERNRAYSVFRTHAT